MGKPPWRFGVHSIGCNCDAAPIFARCRLTSPAQVLKRGRGHTELKNYVPIVFDERGNAVWEWSSSIGAFDDESATQRLSRLENPTLALADDDSPALVARPNPLGKIKGYNPYDSGRLAKPTTMAPTKKTDLRRLSEWMKLKKQAESNKNPR
jgi:hypothetical protein